MRSGNYAKRTNATSAPTRTHDCSLLSGLSDIVDIVLSVEYGLVSTAPPLEAFSADLGLVA